MTLYQGSATKRKTGQSHRTYIIAEAGVNHNGSLDMAKQLVRVAAEAGADAVKFQTFKADKLVSRSAPKAAYQTRTTNAEESHKKIGVKPTLLTSDLFGDMKLSKFSKD